MVTVAIAEFDYAYDVQWTRHGEVIWLLFAKTLIESPGSTVVD